MTELDPSRQKLYDDLSSSIGNTPLVRYRSFVPNGNVIHVKRECDNPWGSHYDRVYLALFKHFEESGQIKPGSKILETTSGSAGVSFAGIGNYLGYECYVALPAGGERARERAILTELRDPSRLILTPAKSYISGFPEFLRGFLAAHPEFFFLNHSMGKKNRTTGKFDNNEVTLRALEDIANEALMQGEINVFAPAVGNGSSVLGPSRVFSKAGIRTTAFEPFQSAVAYELLNPGQYQFLFGVKPGSMSRHRLPGTSFVGIDFPHIRNAVRGGMVDDVVLVTDKKADDEYVAKGGMRSKVEVLPHWDSVNDCDDFGRTTKAGLAVALELSKNTKGNGIMVIGYDKADRYDQEASSK